VWGGDFCPPRLILILNSDIPRHGKLYSQSQADKRIRPTFNANLTLLSAHSRRNVSAGSCRAARRAGSVIASSAGATRTSADPINTISEVDCTP
jgi:hypothetical protein